RPERVRLRDGDELPRRPHAHDRLVSRASRDDPMTPVTLVVLTLNEIDGVTAVIPKLPMHCLDEVLAVDGGSTDGTLEFLAARGLRVIRQARRGRGEAFRLAVEQARHDRLIFFSPDGNEDPADIPHTVDGRAAGHST